LSLPSTEGRGSSTFRQVELVLEMVVEMVATRG